MYPSVSSQNSLRLLVDGNALLKPSTLVTNAWRTKASTISFAALTLCVLSLVLSAPQAQAQYDTACFSGPNIIQTCVGGGAAGGPALSVDLPGPTSAIRDTAGNTYIAAPYSSYIFDLNGGTVSTFTGIGLEGFSGDGGPYGSAGVALPNGVNFDASGNIYISDPGNPRVRVINKTGSTITIAGVSIPAGDIQTVAGDGVRCEPSTGACGDGGKATAANLNFPMSVAIDSAGNIYIADAFDNRIRKVSTTGTISTYIGNGNPCPSPTSACGDGGGSLTSAELNFPQNIVIDGNGNMFIADTRDNRIREVPAGTTMIKTVVGTGAACAPPTGTCGDGGAAISANLHMPMWLYVDSADDLYIADSYDNRIRYVNWSTQTITTVAGTGYPGFKGDGGPATSAQLNTPSSVFLDNAGNLVIADNGNQRIRQVSSPVSSGTISTIAGGGLGNDGGPANNAILADPYNVAVDGSGNIYIADTANNRIREVTASTNQIATIAGNGNEGYTGDGGSALLATLDAPTDIAVDSAGNVFIADSGNLVIREVVKATGNIQTVAGNGSACTNQTAPSGACGDGGLALNATFVDPLSIALDSSDDLFIADFDAHRVREVKNSTQIITTIAGVGVTGHAGNGGLATQAHLDHPSGVAVDTAGDVYISDDYNNQVRVVKSSNSYIYAYAFNNQVTLGGDGGPALDASMWGPIALSIDPNGNLYVGGGNDNIVQRVDAASLTVGTSAGDYAQKGEGGFSGDGGLATAAKLSNLGLAVDDNNHLYIADAGNNRIRTVLLAPIVVLPTMPQNFGTEPLDTTSPAKNVAMSNPGGTDLTGLTFAFTGADPGDFAIPTNTCGTSVAVDVQCTISVTFTPQGYGKRNATLQVTDNASNSPQTVSLTGMGPDFSISASPNTLTINPGSTGTANVTLTPTGNFNQTVSLICLGKPANSTCTLTPSSVTLDGTDNGTSVFSLATESTTPSGTYSITVRGTYGTLINPVTIKVTIP